MKRTIACLVTLVMLVTMLAACGGTSTPQTQPNQGASTPEPSKSSEPVKLTFWANDGSPQWMEVWNSAVERYKAVNPNVTIETFGIPWDTAVTKFTTAAATGTLPDMAHLAATLTQVMMASDTLVDLSPLFEKYEGKNDINQGHLNFYYGMNPKVKGLWTAPMFGSTNQIWYRKDWFEKEGIEFPRTWDEFFEVSKSMTKDGHYGYSFRGGSGNWNLTLHFLMSYTNTSDWFADYEETGHTFFAKPETLEGLTKWISIAADGYAPPTCVSNGYTEMIAEFSSGNAAMAWHHLQSAPLILEKLTPDQLGYGPMPRNSEGVRFVSDEPQGIAVFNTISDENLEAAFDFIKFLWTPEEQLSIVTIAGGVPSNLKTDVEGNEYLKAALNALSEENVKASVLPFFLKDLQRFNEQIVTPDIQAMILKELKPEDALKRWDEEAIKMYEEYLSE